jgi:predicted nucleotidyltransferase
MTDYNYSVSGMSEANSRNPMDWPKRFGNERSEFPKQHLLPVRLSPSELAGLLESFESEIPKHGGGRVWLFGSRVNLQAKGGDIDLYVELNQPLDHKIKFVIRLEMAIQNRLGERKIDIVVKAPNTADSVIHQMAKQRGVLLWQSSTP